jgi:hypothetical protein
LRQVRAESNGKDGYQDENPPTTRNVGVVSSPFIVGLAGHPDLEPTQMPQLVEAASRFLLDLKQHLPDTDLRLMLDPRDGLNVAIARTALAADVSVDAVISARTAEQTPGCESDPVEELLHEPRVQSLAIAPVTSHAPHGSPAAAFVDILLRRSSLLLAFWDGRTSSAPDDTADQVFRFLGVPGEQSEAVNAIEVVTTASDLDLTAQLVFWVPARRCGTVAEGEAAREPFYLLAAGDNVLDVERSMPASLRRRLADLNEYNTDFSRCSDDDLKRGGSLIEGIPAEMASGDLPILRNIDQQFIKAEWLASEMQRNSDRLFNAFGVTTKASIATSPAKWKRCSAAVTGCNG